MANLELAFVFSCSFQHVNITNFNSLTVKWFGSSSLRRQRQHHRYEFFQVTSSKRPLKCRCKLTFRNFHNREVPFSHLNNICKKFISFLRKMGIIDIIPVFISIARVVSQLLSIVYLLINSVFRLSADPSDEEWTNHLKKKDHRTFPLWGGH